MSRSVRGPSYNRPTTAKEPTMCDADERNLRALFILENEWGCGRIDVPAMQRLLRGDQHNQPCDKGETNVQSDQPATTA